jgi:hypothetical protein
VCGRGGGDLPLEQKPQGLYRAQVETELERESNSIDCSVGFGPAPLLQNRDRLGVGQRTRRDHLPRNKPGEIQIIQHEFAKPTFGSWVE